MNDNVDEIDKKIRELEYQKELLMRKQREEVRNELRVNTNSIWMRLLQESESFNGFNGDDVAEKLIGAQDLWLSCAFYPSAYITGNRRSGFGIDLAPMCHVGNNGRWDCDTLWLFSAPGKEEELRNFAIKTLHADEANYLGEIDESLDPYSEQYRNRILRVWWD